MVNLIIPDVKYRNPKSNKKIWIQHLSEIQHPLIQEYHSNNKERDLTLTPRSPTPPNNEECIILSSHSSRECVQDFALSDSFGRFKYILNIDNSKKSNDSIANTLAKFNRIHPKMTHSDRIKSWITASTETMTSFLKKLNDVSCLKYKKADKEFIYIIF